MKKWFRIALITVMGVLLAGGVGFFLYVSDYYKAEEVAIEVMSGSEHISTVDNMTILTPDVLGDTALIFYPGGKVEHTAYLPFLNKLRQKGITCVLVEMPFHLAVFDSDAAEEAFLMLSEIQNWYIGGHSLGGAMASNYAASNSERIKGLILLGAYIYGEVPQEKALTIYGSEDHILDKSKITYTENILELIGGNHGGFGNYGFQKGDGDATISQEEQQDQTVTAILTFMERMNENKN